MKVKLSGLIHSTAPNLVLQSEVQKRRSVSTLSKPRALARGASNGLIFILINFTVFNNVFSQEPGQKESDQQINDFSLSGYGERGKKTWDLAGKTADIFTDNIKLKEVNGNLYNDKENVKVVSKEGDFNKVESKMHLEKDVVITTSSGARLTTDSLDWDRKNDLVTTKDKVNIFRDNTITQAIGAKGQMALSKVELQKNVELQILPDKNKPEEKGLGNEKMVITCDGPLEIDYEKNTAVFNNNVKVDRVDSQIYSDKLEIYFNKNNAAKSSDSGFMNSKVDKIIAKGNVKIIRGENVSYSEEATYSAAESKITLSGKPKLILYSTEGMHAPFRN